jgi:ribose 5-phosphate isomerase RpiB
VIATERPAGQGTGGTEMIITARQLEDLHRQNGGNGRLTLPYRARLTPLAVDWIKSKKIILGYSSVATPEADENKGKISDTSRPIVTSRVDTPTSSASTHAPFLYWCDGPCGPAKAALVAQERESNLRSIDKPADAGQLIAVIKSLASEIKSNRATGGILMVQNGAAAIVFANRCPSLRAILGTCHEAVEQGIAQVATNVLVIEYPHKTLMQVKNMLGRFTRAPRKLSEETVRQIQELASCG